MLFDSRHHHQITRAIISLTALLAVTQVVHSQLVDPETCSVSKTNGCSLGRAPRYLAMAPALVRPDQIFQVFVTVLRLEYGNTPITVHASVLGNGNELATQAVRFSRPSSRILQLQIPSQAKHGNYRLQIKGKLLGKTSGFAFVSESPLKYSPKQASIFIQMSKPLYRQEQMVHFRVIPVKPDLMPKYGTAVIYVEDPTGFPVQRWQSVQTNAGGVMSESFQLADQPNYGTWHIVVEFFSHKYRHPFIVEEFWEPRFDVNVTTPAYVNVDEDLVVKGVMMANHTSGRPCIGNASVSAFFLPSVKVWKDRKLWEKPYYDALKANPAVPPERPEYKAMKDVSVKDYPLYFPYEYRFIDYFEGRYDFEWSADEIKTIAERGLGSDRIEEGEIVFYFNVTDWYSSVVRTGWSGTYIKNKDVTLKWIGGPVRTFKPGSKMTVQLAASHADGTPIEDGSIIRTVTSVDGHKTNEEIRNTDKGVVEVPLNLGLNAQKFTVQASYIGDESMEPYKVFSAVAKARAPEMLGTRYYSTSGSYISVTTSTTHPKVNEYMIFHVSTTQYVSRIFYQIIAKGNIIDGDELEMTSRQKTFSIALSKDMDPVARIVVYYVQLPNEIVADVLNFFINGSNHNQVRLEANLGKDFTRDTIEFNAYADPDSFLITSGVLLDFYQRGLSDGITENKLIDELMSFDEPANGSHKHLWRVSDTDFQYSFYHGNDYGIDSQSSLKHAGLVLMTDINITRLPNMVTCDSSLDQYPCFSGLETMCYSLEERCNGKYDGCPNDGADEWGCEDIDVVERSNPMDRVSRVMRFYDNSTWAWHEIFVKPDGRVDFRVDVPKYPLSWMVNALSVSRDLGLGIMTRPLRYDSVRYMYIQVEHPDKIVMGEQIGIRVTVFNYWYEDDYIEVLITFHAGKDTSFVVVDDFGITSSYKPKTHKGDHQTIVFLEPGQSKDIYMPIIADKDLDLSRGTVNFHVSASCFMEKDEYHGTMKVQSNGVLNYYHTPYMIDLINQPSVYIPNLDIVVPQLFRKSDIRENIYVPGSAAAMTTFFGDVVVPGFFEDYLNAENILHRPYGGGEMATFNFAYNLLSLRFMRQSNQLDETKNTLEVSLGKMRLALQRMYSYMHEENNLVSFKMFRDDPNPSLWLTAFVGKTLSKAIVGEKWERELYIPQKLIANIVGYICTRQDRHTGAFSPLPGEKVFDRKMASLKNSSTSAMYGHEIPLTAYVLIALNDMATNAQNSMGCLETAKRRAATYLVQQANSITSDEVFFMAITTYALSLTDKSSGMLERKLMAMQRNGSYFADSVVYPNPRRPQNNVWYNEPRQELMNEAYAIQSTAYAMMALLPSDTLTKEKRDQMMAWMNTLRNSIGGFASTQDTIVAIEALYAFTVKDPNRSEFDLNINIQSTTLKQWSTNLKLNKSGYVHLEKACLPRNDVYGFIMSSAQGVGRGMLQLTTTVRVEEDKLLKKQMRKDNNPDNPPIPFFSIQTNPIRWSGRNDSVMEMTNCVSWVYTEKSLTSGLAVLEVDIPTGYIAMNDSLRDYVQSGIVRNLRRAEFYGRKVVYYFDHLDASHTCVHFRADRWYPVSNSTQEYRIRVYDYYEPGMHQTQLYKTTSLNRLNICYVCGSYQCPYCPYFNAATLTTAGMGLTMFCFILYAVLKWFVHRDTLGFLDLFIT